MMADEEDGKRIKLCLLSSDFHFALGLMTLAQSYYPICIVMNKLCFFLLCFVIFCLVGLITAAAE